MNRLIFRFVLCVTLLLLVTPAILAQNLSASIKTSFQTGNVAAISQYFSNNLEVNTPVGEGDNRASSISALNNFFASNSPRSFITKHNGAAPNGSEFLIGTLVTSKGTYRVTVALRNNSIEQIDIE